jgi:putative acyl-CoA dehydrogenase
MNDKLHMRDTNVGHTHEVFNQAAPLENYNVATADFALQQGVKRYQGDWGLAAINRHGELTGRSESILLGFQANANKPEFNSHDRFGRRVDEVQYHPAYHALMKMGLEEGLHADAWLDPKPGSHVVRAAKSYLQTQLEPGHGCPLTMTFASVPTLRLTPVVADVWLPKILARGYDPRNVPFTEKGAVTIGMGMTEKQGGSDVRANTTRATPLSASGPGELYALIGHKWFLSAPMCDAFLVLAQAREGLSCFLVPRWRSDGTKNPLEVQRLKNKMGNVSNASSEVEMRGAHGWMVGEPGRGVPAIIEMVAMTRFDCMVGSSGLQRQAVAQALHHCRRRAAFGQVLIDQPLMQNVLADLHLEQRGSLAMTLRMAHALDRTDSEQEQLLRRLGLAVGKYWICKRTPLVTYEAMECLGGNGVMENCIMPRLYREAPINAIWEGSGNVQALDILRAIDKEPEVLDAWLTELGKASHPLLSKVSGRIGALVQSAERQYLARELADTLALSMQAALLLQEDAQFGELFICSRLGSEGLRQFGSLPAGFDLPALLKQALVLD